MLVTICFLLGFTLIYTIVWGIAAIRLFRQSRSALSQTQSPAKVPQDSSDGQSDCRLSVVIPCRNEALRIIKLLETLACQTMPFSEWEVVFVDDQSTDSTSRVIANWIKAHPQIRARLICAPEPGGKKNALAAGIDAAHNPIILTTDADCHASNRWLAEMAGSFANPSVQFAIGLVVYESTGSLLQELQRGESLGLVSLGAAAALMGHPFLANGANLAFRRAAFRAVGGYSHGKHLASGDDTFLIEAMQKAHFAGVLLWQRDTLIWTQPTESWSAYWQQNVRWLSKARASHNPKQRLLQILGLIVWGSWWPILVGLVWTLHSKWAWILFGLATGLRLISDLVLTQPLLNLAGLRRHWRAWLLAQPIYAAWVPAVALRALSGGSYTWRGRRVN